MINFIDAILKSLITNQDKVAIVDNGGQRETTYAQLQQEAMRVAAYLNNANIPTQSCITISLPKSMEYFAAEIGCWMAGHTVVPMGDHFPKERIDYIQHHCNSPLCIDTEIMSKANVTTPLAPLWGKGLGERGCPLFALFYTSGSTGTPKGVMHTLESFSAGVERHTELCDMKNDDVFAGTAPMYFIACTFDYTALVAGATVHIYPEEARTDVELMSKYILDHKVTKCFMSPTMVAQYSTLTSDPSALTSPLRLVITGSERLSNVKSNGFELRNAYGQTETTGVTTYFTVDKEYDNTPIGHTVAGVDLDIQEGEICLKGCFSPGYYKDEERTANLIKDGWLHTGDLGEIRDGNLIYTNRKDWMVKISGQRVEPGEVEAVMKKCPGIKDAIVKGFQNKQGNNYLCGFWMTSPNPSHFDQRDQSRGEIEVTDEYITNYLKQYLPEYMIPTCYSKVNAFPLNANGKVDRKSLISPLEQGQGSMANGQAEQLNSLEQELKSIISSILGTDTFSREDNLGYLGLTSITSIKLATAVFKKFGVELDAKSLAKSGSLLSIENDILNQYIVKDQHTDVSTPIHSLRREGQGGGSRSGGQQSVPLSFSQQGVYTDCMAEPGSVEYNLPELLTFPAGTTAEQLKDAVSKVVTAHPYMACHFLTNESGDVVQQPIENFQLDIPVKTVTTEEFEDIKKSLVRPFDLNKGPLFRFEIFEITNSPNSNLSSPTLYIDIHHLISDGASSNMIYHQICDVLDGKEIEPETYDYYQFVRDQKPDASAEDYLDQTIGGIEEVSRLLPDIFEETPSPLGEGGGRGSQHTVTSPLDVPALDDICHKHGITPAAFFLAASALTVSRYLCEEDVTMITISNGRSNLRISDTVGMFVNTLPLAFHVGTQDSTETLFKHASAVFAAAIEHETYPFARVASKYGFTPQISYACQLGVIESLSTQGGEVKMESLDLDIAKAPIAIFIEGTKETGMYVKIDFDSSLYTDTMAQHFAQSIANAAAALATKQNVSQVSLTTESDWAQLDTFNLPFFTNYDHNDTVVSLFQKQVQKHPDKTAAIYADKRYTYRQLDEATDRLAAVIYDKVSTVTGKANLAEQVVSIIIDRNEWVFLLPLAVLKTGCAYEPLDPSYPSDRLNYMVQDAKAKLLIGQPEFIPQVSEYKGEVLLTTDLASTLADTTPLHSLRREGHGGGSVHDLLLMLYTSGSTGKPKGVQIEHHSLVSYAHGIAKADFYTEDCVAAAYASFGFDVCMSDTFCTLLNGGTLVVIPESMRLELKQLAEYLESEHVTQIFMTTQVGVQFLQNYPNVKYLRYLGMGGEKLPAVHPEGLSYHILNGYGPTENTCGVSLYPIQHWEPNIPLGRPFPTIKGFVLDKSGHRLPPGACGEYCVAGDQPARGYLGLPEKTAEVFVTLEPSETLEPFEPSLRMYHTGDVVRYRENGDVEFVGRKDGMVKIRGFRIELKEVEAAIRPFEGIKDVTVQAYDYDGGGKYLAAFVVSDTKVDVSALLDFVKSQKPPYMVPAIVMQIDRIPLTVNQKVDKKALPKPQLAAAAYVAPANKIEQDFCEIFAEVLGQEKISAASDFFEIGGSSIIALKVVVAAEKRGYTIVYNDVFSYTTAQTMAEHLSPNPTSPKGEESRASEVSDISPMREMAKPEGALPEISPDGYDYKEINALLRGNTMEAFQNGQQQPIDDVLLTGATGYLGIHVLKDLIDNYTGQIYCFVRRSGEVSGEHRLKNLLFYYFENSYSELFASTGSAQARISVIEGDATDPHALDNFTPSTQRGSVEVAFTVINCAACVKHFSKGNEIERINVESVRNIIAWCIKTGARLVHVSTGSVAGASVNNVPPKGYLFDEHVLYCGQLVDNNQYISSKFKAERIIYEAILHHGLNAKVMRVGNLAPRDKDGEFQVNFKTNNFMATLAAFKALGMIPYAEMDSHVEFSPIDYVARSILLLATTPKECVCFMASNHHRPHMGDIVMQLDGIRMVEMDEFQQAIRQALSDPAKVDKMRPFMAYAGAPTNENIRQIGYDDIDVNYTVQVLYRLGFSWPTTTEEYVRKFIRTISGFNFFD